MATEKIHNVASDLESLLHPVDQLELLPGNYNSGDIDGVMNSYKEFGQRKAIVAKEKRDGKGVVLAGNTQLQAARRLGWTHIAVSWVREDEGWDDAKASSFAVTDNETGKRGEEDLQAKREMLGQFEDDFGLLNVAGFDIADLQAMDELIGSGPDEIPLIGDSVLEDDDDGGDDNAPATPVERKKPRAVIQASIIFDTEEQQETWFEFIRWLKREYPEHDTVAERLTEYVQGVVPE